MSMSLGVCWSKEPRLRSSRVRCSLSTFFEKINLYLSDGGGRYDPCCSDDDVDGSG